ncbi:hypothetical protein ACEWY4_022283 [Coilia grayii]|uniref:DUF6729 domain-containing protein n=1 Tax=Coilia grayii TaxID=363190 RepID=A0ABD1J7E5_9TELE
MFVPLFCFELPSSSDLTLRPTAAAMAVAQQHCQEGAAVAWRVLSADDARAEARTRVLSKGGLPGQLQVLAETGLQFGQYRGQTLQWLLGNDVGYACGVIVSHEKERESGDASQSPLMLNKDALASYAAMFPPMVTAVARRRMREGTRSVRGLDEKLVGFGQHGHKTHKALYDARDAESRSYVQWIRGCRTGAGSRMHDLKRYVLARDEEGKTAAAAPEPARASAAPGVSSSGPGELSDADLLSAAIEVDSPQSCRATPPATPPASLSFTQRPLERRPHPELAPPAPAAPVGPPPPQMSVSGAQVRLSGDRSLIRLLPQRTLGNSAPRLCASLVEQHTREWTAQSMAYLSVLRKLRVPAGSVASHNADQSQGNLHLW